MFRRDCGGAGKPSNADKTHSGCAFVSGSAGCTEPNWLTSDFEAPPAELQVDAGDKQTGFGGMPLSTPLSVWTNWSTTHPNEQIEWTVLTGGGTITAVPRAVTWAPYQAKWILGPAPGKQTVRATWTNSGLATAACVMFEATAVPAQ